MKIVGKIRTNPIIKEGNGWKLIIYDINRELFSTFNEAFFGFKMGDEVEIEYEKGKTGKYNNIKTMHLVNNTGLSQFKQNEDKTENVELIDVQRIIVRQNALSNANELLKTCYDKYIDVLDRSKPTDVLKKIAEELEEWVFRWKKA